MSGEPVRPVPAEPRPGEAEDGRSDAPPPLPLVVEQPPGEVAGPKGPEPTRFGDWEKDGRCSDF